MNRESSRPTGGRPLPAFLYASSFLAFLYLCVPWVSTTSFWGDARPWERWLMLAIIVLPVALGRLISRLAGSTESGRFLGIVRALLVSVGWLWVVVEFLYLLFFFWITFTTGWE